MDREDKVMCDKTLNRKDSVEKNTVDNMTVVDALISKSTRRNIEATAKKYGFKIQFLYSSDLDGWYDDISKTMYLALDHAMKRSVMVCFNREIKENHLQCVRAINTKGDFVQMLRILALCLFLTFIAAFVIYMIFASQAPSETASYIGIGGLVAIVLLFIIELFIYRNSDRPLQVKKKEDSVDPMLGTVNNIGGMMERDRIDINSGWGVYYNYLAFWGVPIIFLGTYLAQEVETGTWRKRSYKVLCQVKTPIREIYHFYIMRYGGLIFTISIFCGVYWFGTWMEWWS